MALIQLDDRTDTDLFLSELSPPPDQDVTIQFSHGRFVPSDSLNPESGDHPDIAPFLNTEQHVSFSASSSPVPCGRRTVPSPLLWLVIHFGRTKVFILSFLVCLTPSSQTLSGVE